jgi:hypothetical protein
LDSTAWFEHGITSILVRMRNILPGEILSRPSFAFRAIDLTTVMVLGKNLWTYQIWVLIMHVNLEHSQCRLFVCAFHVFWVHIQGCSAPSRWFEMCHRSPFTLYLWISSPREKECSMRRAKMKW